MFLLIFKFNPVKSGTFIDFSKKNVFSFSLRLNVTCFNPYLCIISFLPPQRTQNLIPSFLIFPLFDSYC
jgi:hypothetical protein